MAFINCNGLGNDFVKKVHSQLLKRSSSTVTEGQISKTNIYIKGLPSHFHDGLLAQILPFPNKVRSLKTAMDNSGKCKGYGFIDFVDNEAAEETKNILKKKYPNNQIIFAKEYEKDKTNLYVSNIPTHWTNRDNGKLKEIFENCGHIKSSCIMVDRETNKATGCGFVRFSKEEDATKAIAMLNTTKIIFSPCEVPISAKFADKHNQEMRKRRNDEVISNPCKYPSFLNYQREEDLVGLESCVKKPSYYLWQNSLSQAFFNNYIINYPLLSAFGNQYSTLPLSTISSQLPSVQNQWFLPTVIKHSEGNGNR